MKALFRAAANKIASNDFSYSLLEGSLVRVAEAFVRARQKEVDRRRARSDAQLAKQLSPRLEVLHGPFRGMLYPSAVAAGSVMLPKIVGCYERELHGVWKDLATQSFDSIVIVGSGEGYYSVGLARLYPQAQVFAFDIDPHAQELTLGMASANGVDSRVRIGAACTPDFLTGLNADVRHLVLSDCEGFEIELFNSAAAQHLHRSTVVIEVHDILNPGISGALRERFSASHTLTVIESVDDLHKLRQYDYAETQALDLLTRRRVFSEYRASIMDWFVFRPRDK